MTAQITEVLMGLGSFDVSFKHDAAILAALDVYDHAVFYDGETRIYTGVILKRRPGRTPGIGGSGFDWWLGLDSDGPQIGDREYIAGTNKLSNGDFGDGDLLWRLAENTAWTIGAGSATLAGQPADADTLQSDETFECRPGDQLKASLQATHGSASPGRVRMRLVYQGRFKHPNLLAGTTWTVESLNAGDAAVSAGSLIMGPVTQRQSIINDSFESGLANWYDDTGTSWVIATPTDYPPFDAAKFVRLAAFGAGRRVLLHDHIASNGAPPIDYIDVVPGEKLFLQGAMSPWALGGTVHADGGVYFGCIVTNPADQSVTFKTETLGVKDVPNSSVSGSWVLVSTEFTVPAGRTLAVPFIQANEVTVGRWGFDAFTLTHLEHNTAILRAADIVVQPGRTYRLLASVTSDATVDNGDLKAVVTFTDPARTDMVVESSTMGATGGVEKLFAYDFTAPSGYAKATVRFVVTDVSRGSFRIPASSITVVDTDVSTRVQDATTAATATVTVSSTAPAGVERFHVEVIVDANQAGWVAQSWTVGAVNAHRTETPAAAAAIVAALLTDPDTGLPLIPAGNIRPAGTIAYDWRIRNMTDREALKHLSNSGLVTPVREWRIRPDASLDWGLPTEIFVDRTDLVLLENDLVIRGVPTAEHDATGRLTRIKVIGADRTPVGGMKRIITGAATVSPGPAKDWFGRALSRTRIIDDSTIDTTSYAAGRASIELATNGTPADAVTVQLADWATAGRFDVGDWIYVYAPVADLVDYANPVERDGATIFPAKKRVLERTRRLGAGFRVELRASDGTTRDVTEFVDWEPETSADVKLGELLPEFALDPQGGAAGAQFRRFRGSSNR